MVVQSFDFTKAAEELQKSGSLVSTYLDSDSGANVTVNYTELTGLPQSISIDRGKDLPIPMGSVVESSWRDILAQNRNLKIRKKIFEVVTPPILKLIPNAMTGFLFHDNEKFQGGIKEIVDEIVKQYVYTMFDTKVQYLAMGVPPPVAKGGKTLPHGAAYSGFRDNLDAGSYGNDFESGKYPVIDFSDGEGKATYRGSFINELVKKAVNSR